MTERIFEIIADNDGIISGLAIGEKLGISRNAVNKHVAKLQNLGVNILSERKGYRYVDSDCLTKYTLQYKINKLNCGIEVVVAECDSTNNLAKQFSGSSKPYVVVAPKQTQGKGRLKREFVSHEGGVYLTMLYRPDGLSVIESLNIVLLSGLAVCKLLEMYGLSATIKWPNDVFVGDKKICGILLESSIHSEYLEEIYLGIGINVNNSIDEISNIATSILQEKGVKSGREDLIVRLVAILIDTMQAFGNGNVDALREEYLSKSRTIGNYVSVRNGDNVISGQAIGLTNEGYLLLQTESGVEKIVVGDIMQNM